MDVSPLTYKDFYHWVLGYKGHEEDECPFIHVATQQMFIEHLLRNRHWAARSSGMNHQLRLEIRACSPEETNIKQANTPTSKVMEDLVLRAQDKASRRKPPLSTSLGALEFSVRTARGSLIILSLVSIPGFQLLPNQV